MVMLSYSSSMLGALAIALVSFFIIPTARCLALGGISNTKVVLPSAETVPKGHLEFEPVFGLFLVDDDADTKEFEAGARFTLGALDSAEIGINVSFLRITDSEEGGAEEDFGDIDAGLKYRFIDQAGALPFSLAYQGGVTFPTGGTILRGCSSPRG